MTAIFSGFIFGDNAAIKSVGFALAFGVLVDVLVVRMAIVPAVKSMFGRTAWWLPRWLARVLPNVDVEGQSLPDRRSDDVDAGEDDGVFVLGGLCRGVHGRIADGIRAPGRSVRTVGCFTDGHGRGRASGVFRLDVRR